MAKIQDLTVKVTLNGALDYDKIAEEVKAAVKREVERVGVSVEFGDKQAQRPTTADYIKVLEDDGRNDVTIGEIRKIVEDDNSDCPFYAKTLNDEHSNWFEEHDVVLATDEEVAEAKRKQAEEAVAAKWTSINRKPNEFKTGDIVEFTDDYTDIGIVEDIGGGREEDNVIGVRTKRDKASYQAPKLRNVKLITPVEARFDR
jgi:hypothetical protein